VNALRIRRAAVLLGGAALLAIAASTPARADTVTDWNQQATDTLIVTAGQGPTVSVLHLAMVHGAVYDAVNAIDRRHEPYLGAPRAQRWYSKDAAAATAAYRVLVSIVPAQQAALQARYQASLAAIPEGKAKAGGIAVGEASAAQMIAARTGDGRFGPFRFLVGSEPGQWRPVLPAFVNDPNAWVAQVRPFLIDSPATFRSDGPNALDSKRYAREFAEVKSIGSLNSTTRTADQTDMARFWAEHALAMWSRVFRQLSAGHYLGTAENSRFFAMMYLTAADAAISCWDDKAHWGFWRPITAIREADTDGNPATDPDPGWLPLVATPPYPDHPSGHGCVSSSIVESLRDFFGTDRAEFSVTSATSGTTRSFTRFSQAIEEIIDARVYSGIHFRSADVQGARLGKQVARYRDRHYFGPEHRCHRE
jgi:PAP2 superfamily